MISFNQLSFHGLTTRPDTPPSPGILAIWNDCARGTDAEFEHGFQSERLAERLALPGFRLGRRHEAVSGSPRYFVVYRTDTPEVLTSEAYLDRAATRPR